MTGGCIAATNHSPARREKQARVRLWTEGARCRTPIAIVPTARFVNRGQVMKGSIVASLLAAMASSGCAATIESRSLKAGDLAPEAPPIRGIVHYPPTLMKVTYEYSARVDDKGNVLGTADSNTCKAIIQKEELQVLPDFDRPMALLNRPAALANSKFSAALSNGMLQSVNSETASIAADLLTAVSAAAEVASAARVAPSGGDACNAAPRIAKMQRATTAGSPK